MLSREQKIRRKAKRERLRAIKKRARLEQVLKTINAIEAFKKLPVVLQQKLADVMPPPIMVEITADDSECPAAGRAADNMQAVLDSPDPLGLGSGILPISEFLSTLAWLEAMREQAELLSLPGQQGPLHPIFVCCNSYWDEHFQRIMRTLDVGSALVSSSESKIDGDFFSIALTKGQNGNATSPPSSILVSRRRAESVPVTIDSSTRPAYPCRVAASVSGDQVLKVEASVLGLPSEDWLPVFVQSHALRRLRQRYPFARDRPYFPEAAVFLSLSVPTVVYRRGDTSYVECVCQDVRIGYLTVMVADGKAVVTSFLFLTMRGTPEARQIFQRFDLQSEEIEYHGLDKFDTFRGAQLREQPELVSMLEDCGCGPMMRLAEQYAEGVPKNDIIRELAQYLDRSGTGRAYPKPNLG